MNSLYDEVEAKARAATTCPACGIEKDKGLVVCWTCFKKPGGLKYSGLTLSAWLAAQQTAQKYMKLKTKVTAHFGATGIAAAMVGYGTRSDCESWSARHPDYKASYSVCRDGLCAVNLVRIGRELGNPSPLNA